MRTRLVPVALLLLALVACKSDQRLSASPSSTRRTTKATMRILEPTAGETVGKTVTIRLRVDGEPLLDVNDVTATFGGHIHLYVDGRLEAMTKDPVKTVTLPAGQHTIRAEFVAANHQPFLDPVVRTVVFTVT